MTDFDNFWTAFPREGQNVGPKHKARSYYDKINTPMDKHDEIMEALSKITAWRKEARRQGMFVPTLPYIFRWLRDYRWLDELPELRYQGGSFMDRITSRDWAN